MRQSFYSHSFSLPLTVPFFYPVRPSRSLEACTTHRNKQGSDWRRPYVRHMLGCAPGCVSERCTRCHVVDHGSCARDIPRRGEGIHWGEKQSAMHANKADGRTPWAARLITTRHVPACHPAARSFSDAKYHELLAQLSRTRRGFYLRSLCTSGGVHIRRWRRKIRAEPRLKCGR
jgi:hypothetical protein